MKFYFRCMSINLKSQMQYRLSFFLTIIGQFIFSFTSFFGVQFMFQYMDSMYGFTKEQVFLCFAIVTMAFAIGEMFGGGLATFARVLGNGEFDRANVRPRSVIMQVVMMNLDFTRSGLLIQSVLVLCYAIPRCKIVWNAAKIVTITMMILCGGIVFFGLFWIKATVSFFTLQNLDFLNFLTYGTSKFGRYPVSVFGDEIRKVFTYIIPLALFQYYPFLYLLDRKKEPIYMFMPVISLLFLIPCYLFYRFGASKYQSIGS